MLLKFVVSSEIDVKYIYIDIYIYIYICHDIPSLNLSFITLWKSHTQNFHTSHPFK